MFLILKHFSLKMLNLNTFWWETCCFDYVNTFEFGNDELKSRHFGGKLVSLTTANLNKDKDVPCRNRSAFAVNGLFFFSMHAWCSCLEVLPWTLFCGDNKREMSDSTDSGIEKHIIMFKELKQYSYWQVKSGLNMQYSLFRETRGVIAKQNMR